MPIGLQELIYKLEMGEGARWIRTTALLLGLLALTALYDWREYKSFNNEESMEAAQLARNIAEGKGYVSQCIRPLTLYLLQKKGVEPSKVLAGGCPDLVHPPVYPMILAGLFKILPAEFMVGDSKWEPTSRHPPEFAVALLNQAIWFAVLFLVFRMASRLFDSTVAWLTVLTLAGTALFWQFTVSGLSTLLLMFWTVLLVQLLLRLEANGREPKRGIGWELSVAIGIGALLGLGMLTRYGFGWLAIPTLIFIALFGGARRVVTMTVALVVFSAVVAPWLSRNYMESGTLFGIPGYAVYAETKPFPGNRLERYLTAEVEVAQDRLEWDDFPKKLLLNAAEMFQNELPKFGGSWVSAFFLISLLIPFQSKALNRIRIFLVLSLLTLVCVQAMGKTHLTTDVPVINSENWLVLLAPVAFIFGAGMFVVLLEQLELPFPPLRTAGLGAYLLLLSAPLLIQLLPPRNFALAYPPYYPPILKQIGQWMKPGELVMSDMPWAVAWYGGRNCLLLTLEAPLEKKASRDIDFYKLHDFQKPIQALYLTPLSTDGKFISEFIRNRNWEWGKFAVEAFMRTNVPPGFPLLHAHSGLPMPEQVFLTDRPRWRRSGD